VTGWRPAFDRPLVRIGLVAGFAALLVIRMPGVLQGRLWAEEGRVFYEHAASMPPWQALFLPYAGYLNLVANAAPIIARSLVPLEDAPWIVTFIGLIFQCCPAILLVCARDAWLRSPLVRIAALLLIATAPQVEEVWLQTLHSQFHLALCAAMILALDIPQRRLAIFGGVLLFLGPLCGPPACIMAPLLLARAAIDRSWTRLWQTCALGAGAALQVLLFYSHESGRTYGIGPIVLLCVVYIKQIVIPLFGVKIAIAAVAQLQARIAAHLFPWRAVTASLALFAAVCAALLRGRQAASIWLFLAACCTGWIGYYGAIGDNRLGMLAIGGNGRYVFLPEVLSSLAMLALAAGSQRPERWVARAAVGWLILIGVLDLRTPDLVMKTGPSWRQEVALWRQDHTHPIAIWPQGWFMVLNHE
jgi:hypothetical protein